MSDGARSLVKPSLWKVKNAKGPYMTKLRRNFFE